MNKNDATRCMTRQIVVREIHYHLSHSLSKIRHSFCKMNMQSEKWYFSSEFRHFLDLNCSLHFNKYFNEFLNGTLRFLCRKWKRERNILQHDPIVCFVHFQDKWCWVFFKNMTFKSRWRSWSQQFFLLQWLNSCHVI